MNDMVSCISSTVQESSYHYYVNVFTGTLTIKAISRPVMIKYDYANCDIQ